MGVPQNGFPQSEVLQDKNRPVIAYSRGSTPGVTLPGVKGAQALAGKYKVNAGYLKLVQAAASNAQIEPEFLAAIITVENSGYAADVTRPWNPKAVSPAGAQGIAQFMPGTWAQYGKGGSPFKPEDAIPAAARLLAALLKANGGNRNQAAQSYNGGSYRGAETARYAGAMEKAYQEYKRDSVFAGQRGSLSIPNPLDALDPVKDAASAIADVAALILSPRRWGDLLAKVSAYFLKFLGKALWDYLVAPIFHWHQRAALYYANEIMPGKAGSGFYYSTAGIVTVSFWATGYAILWAKVDDGVSLFADPKDTPLAKAITGTRNAAARRKLTEPGKVKAETPDKPEPVKSSTNMARVNTLSVARGRPVTVKNLAADAIGSRLSTTEGGTDASTA